MRAKIVAGLLVLLALVVLPMLPEGAVRRALGGKEPGEGETVQATDGFYALADRSVACRVSDGWIACDNGRVTMVCQEDACTAHYLDGDYDDRLRVTNFDARKPEYRVLQPKTFLELPRMGCWVAADHIECRVIDFNGGFQMSGLFARLNAWDDAPPGWPWDGRRYTAQDRVPGI